jgi:uncharacterized SAM-binding protein YcdF (DUF218 family)
VAVFPVMRRLVLFGLVVLALAYAVGVPLFLERDDDPLPSTADAVVVLSGGSDERLTTAEAIVGGGIAENLVISANRGDRGSARTRPCRTKTASVLCVYPGPFSTVDEEKAISQVAERRNWDTVVIVTSRYNLFRAERMFRRCGNFRIVEVGVDEPWWRVAIDVPLEWVKLGVSETVRRGC